MHRSRLKEGRLKEGHRKIGALWRQVWQDQRAEQQAQQAELAEAKATAKQARDDAAPGSVAELKRVQAFLDFARTSHRVSLDPCNEAGAELDKLPAERAEAQP